MPRYTPKNPRSPLLDVIPKGAARRDVTELHVHLGGSVPLFRLWEMGIERGIRGVAGSYEDFISLLHRSAKNTGNLDRYLEIFDTVEMIQAGPSAVAEAVRIAINGAYRTGGMRKLGPGGEGGDPDPVFAITKLELRFNPMKRTGAMHTRSGDTVGLYDVDRIIRAACESAEESEIAYRGGIQTGLIFCFGRDLPWEVNRTLAEKIKHWKKTHPKVIGIDLAGPESAMTLENPADLEKMAEIYDCAGDEIGRTVHVGETPHISLDTFINTLKALRPHRVGHPVIAARAFWDSGDARGLELLAEKKIVCELCIHSNLLTKAITSIQEYGKFLKTLDDFKIDYTFSTDSPALQLTTLAAELEYLLESGSATPEQVIRAFDTADRSTFINMRRN